MMARAASSLMALAVLCIAGRAGVVDTLAELGPALTGCFRAPPNSAGSQLTVLLSLDRAGAVQGKPRITYSHLLGRPEDKRAFADAVLASLGACTPVRLSPALGGAVAGRPLSIRFVGEGPAAAI